MGKKYGTTEFTERYPVVTPLDGLLSNGVNQKEFPLKDIQYKRWEEVIA